MPYGVVFNRKLNKWTVIKKDTGKILGRHDSEAAANKQKVAILINEHEPKPKRK